jgi:hypothetical protein
MNCRDVEAHIVELARGAGPEVADEEGLGRHLDECPACAARLARQRQLTAALQDLSRMAEPSPRAASIEAELLRAFARQQDEARPKLRAVRPVLAAAAARPWLAAAAALLLAVVVWQGVVRWRSPDASRPAVAAEELRFVALPTAVGLPPLESGRVVRVALPVTVLPAYGLDVAPASPDSFVEADVLVGQDDQPRAIRFVSADADRDQGRRP